MSFRKTAEKFLCRIVFERPITKRKLSDQECEDLLRREATDWLYYLLGASTYIYLLLLAVLFFAHTAGSLSKLLLFLNGLQNPYLGALGIYVVLKEIRKHRRKYPSKYLGELFVALWFVLLVVFTIVIWVSPRYDFDEVYNLTLNNSLVVGLIYLGAFINKP